MDEIGKSLKLKLIQIKNTLDSGIDKRFKDLGLMGGVSGIVLFYFYYAKSFKDDEANEKGHLLLYNIFETINKGVYYDSFANGIVGIGWVVEHLLENDFIETSDNNLLLELDNCALLTMDKGIGNNDFDYLHSALGNGIYFLSRLKKNNLVKDYLIKLVDAFEDASEFDILGGLKWPTLNEGRKIYNLSLSHGIASNIVFLTKVLEYDIYSKKAYKLLSGSVNYLINNQLNSSRYCSVFPNYVCDSEDLRESRLAWCYGDLGIGIALYQASVVANNEQWKELSMEVILKTTKRKSFKNTYVNDAGLCHGTAGIAHIYNRMYKNTGISEFKIASNYWFNQTLKMAKHKDGLAGYKTWQRPEYGNWSNEFGLLDGIAGIGLAILSKISKIEPAWDRCLLLS